MRQLILAIVLGAVATVLSWRSLPELDLGWHLATGLWMLDQGRVPWLDPFGAESRQWIAYSWLFEVLLARIYRSSGFLGLQVVQMLLISSVLFGLLHTVRCRAEVGSHLELVAVFCAVVLISPFLYLRPQLLSVLFLLGVIVALERRGMRSATVVLVAVLWASIHVYWIALPGLLLLYGVSERAWLRVRQAGYAAFFGLCTPYHLHLLSVLTEYVSNHQTANAIITEFQRLGFSHGLYFYAGILAALIVLVLLYWARARVSLPLKVFATASAVAALYQIKYLSLLSIALPLVLVRAYTATRPTRESAVRETYRPVLTMLGFVVGMLSCSLALWLFQGIPSALTAAQGELFHLVRYLPEHQTRHVVLHRFDDGGFMAFAFYEANKDLKTSIDGRTLVMGERRLAAYRQLAQADEQSCAVIKDWKVASAVLRVEDPLAALLASGSCGEVWRSILDCEHWQLWFQPQLISDMRRSDLQCP